VFAPSLGGQRTLGQMPMTVCDQLGRRLTGDLARVREVSLGIGS
jgi:hypothetical protein